MIKPRTLAITAGASYLVIFFAAVFANFFVLEAMTADPLGSVRDQPMMVRVGIMAFMVTVVFDVVVAWALYELYKAHPLSGLSTLFRMMHAAIMGVAVFALTVALTASTGAEVLAQVDLFNTIWLIGLFFFGIHLILLGRILGKPGFIALFLVLAGLVYMIDTTAHFLLSDYDLYSAYFLAMVAVPSIIGELSLAVWLLVRGGRLRRGKT